MWGLTLAPEWQGWGPWRWGEETDTLDTGREEEEEGRLEARARVLRAKATPRVSSLPIDRERGISQREWPTLAETGFPDKVDKTRGSEQEQLSR